MLSPEFLNIPEVLLQICSGDCFILTYSSEGLLAGSKMKGMKARLDYWSPAFWTCSIVKSYNFETVIRLCSCFTDRQISVWEVPWQPRRASARWLFSAEGLWTGCSGEALLGLDRLGAWYCPFREILHLLNLLPSAFWSVLLYCRMKCLIQF